MSRHWKEVTELGVVEFKEGGGIIKARLAGKAETVFRRSKTGVLKALRFSRQITVGYHDKAAKGRGK